MDNDVSDRSNSLLNYENLYLKCYKLKYNPQKIEIIK